MYAALKTAGTQPVISERLNSSVKKGARTWMTDLSVGVGSGSRAQLLSGSTRTAATWYLDYSPSLLRSIKVCYKWLIAIIGVNSAVQWLCAKRAEAHF